MNLILFLIIGGVAGWLAGLIMKGRGFGILAEHPLQGDLRF